MSLPFFLSITKKTDNSFSESKALMTLAFMACYHFLSCKTNIKLCSASNHFGLPAMKCLPSNRFGLIAQWQVYNISTYSLRFHAIKSYD